MRKGHSKRLARLGTGVVVLLVVQCFCASRSAWAGCSHLVQSRSDRFHVLDRLDLLIENGSGQSPFEPSAPARRSPCAGLSCSSRESLPISTATPGSDGSFEQGCALDRLVVPSADSHSHRPFAEPARPLMVERQSIFHPPRV
jgi:hypothetical protein